MKIDRENFLRFPPAFLLLKDNEIRRSGLKFYLVFPTISFAAGNNNKEKGSFQTRNWRKISGPLEGGRTNQLEELSKSKVCLALS
jgi:hypothetical protein